MPCQDLMLYCDQVEGALKLQNEKLQDELQASQLDLADAAKLARDLQRQLQVYEAHTGWLVTENEQLKVPCHSTDPSLSPIAREVLTKDSRNAIRTFWL